MSDDRISDQLVGRMVRVILDAVETSATPSSADEFRIGAEAELSAVLSRVRREGKNPVLADAIARVLGALYDATESGGTRR